jgi:hypothetical protein
MSTGADDREARALGAVVAGEARRALSTDRIEADPARVAAGWERRFVTDGPRVEEMMRVYRELGYDVLADPIQASQMLGDCTDCRLLILFGFRMIYTRRPTA